MKKVIISLIVAGAVVVISHFADDNNKVARMDDPINPKRVAIDTPIYPK